MLSYSVTAMEEEFHRPYFKDEVLKTIEAQLKAYERCLSTELGDSACEGLMMPWLGSFALGAYLGVKDDAGSIKDKIGKGFSGGVISTICLSVISILLSIPLALGNMGYVTVRYLIDGVKALQHEQEFEREMARHLFQWMDVVKRGRLAIRAELKAIEAVAAARHQDFSLSDAASDLLRNETFDKYFASVSWNTHALEGLLSQLDEAHNTWEHLFHTVSWRMKIPELNEQQWTVLEKKLQTHIGEQDGFAGISDADIKEYLYCAIYFFTIANPKHLKMLGHYVG